MCRVCHDLFWFVGLPLLPWSVRRLACLSSFLGASDIEIGGLFPGLLFYLSYFYPRQRLQGRLVHLPPYWTWLRIMERVSMFFCGSSLAAAFSGLLAYGLVKMHNLGGRPGWAWIFIIEGVFTVLFGLVTFPFLPRTPKEARFLSDEEKEYVAEMLALDGAAEKDEKETDINWKEVKKGLTLPHIVVMGLLLLTGGGQRPLCISEPRLTVVPHRNCYVCDLLVRRSFYAPTPIDPMNIASHRPLSSRWGTAQRRHS